MNHTFFRQCIVARCLSTLGSQFMVFAIPLMVFKSTGSITKSGIAFAIEWMIGILALPLGGIFADRWGGHKVYQIADAMRALACMIGFLLIKKCPETLFITASLTAGTVSFFSNQAYVALESIVPLYLSSPQLPKGQAMMQTADQLCQMTGPILAAMVVPWIGNENLLLMTACTFAISFIHLLLNATRQKTTKRPPPSFLKNIREGWQVLKDQPILFRYCLYAIKINLIYTTLLALSAPITTGVYGKSNSTYGVFISLAGLITVLSIASVPWIMKRISIQTIGLYASYSISAGGFLIAASHSFFLFCIGFFIVIAADGVATVFLRSERVKIIPPEHLGKTLGLMIFIIGCSYPLGGALVSLLAKPLGIHKLLFAVSLFSITGNHFVFKSLRRLNASNRYAPLTINR